MPLTINTNMAASRASYFLSKNNDALQKSLDRLSSGKRITQPSDDAGGLAVSMKMQGTIDNLNGAANNVANALSFLQVQDGILDSVANIVGRMGELKALTQDVLKSTDDINTYNSEFADLQKQLNDLGGTEFNSVALFTTTATTDGSTAGAQDSFAASATALHKPEDTTVIGAGSSEINISKSLLLPALTFKVTYTAGAFSAVVNHGAEAEYDGSINDSNPAANGDYTVSLAVADVADAATFDQVDAAVFTKALENVATMRATNGGEAKRLQYEQQNIATQATNMTAALGRIMDVDIAAETTNLAKQQILVQASASMVAQANSANQVALMLLQ